MRKATTVKGLVQLRRRSLVGWDKNGGLGLGGSVFIIEIQMAVTHQKFGNAGKSMNQIGLIAWVSSQNPM